MAKLVYIAHQVAGNIQENVKDILNICRVVHSPDIIPVAPYLVAVQYLNDGVTEERELGIAANREFFKRKIMDEVWVCGPGISSGMREEIKLSLEYNIPIKCHNPELQSELDSLIDEYRQDRHTD